MLIKNIKILDPLTGTQQVADVLIENGKIAKIGSIGDVMPDIDGSGLTLAPGLIDIHVHFREPGLEYKEDIHSGANAAKKGGFTTVITMANTKPAVDTAETLRYVIEAGKKTGINVLPCAAVTVGLAGKQLVNMAELKSAGAVGFTDDGAPIMDEELLRQAMATAKELDMPISLHEEDPAFIGVMGINEGEVSRELGIQGAPAKAEEVMIFRDVNIAYKTGAKVNIQHISTKGGVELVGIAKKEGTRVCAEATPQHFSATQELVRKAGANAKVNPPLRTEEDRLAIIEGLKNGIIDFIATDHAPHSNEEKNRELKYAPSGMIGLETALSLGITHLVRPGHISLIQLIEKMTINPAKFYGLDSGYIAVGATADFVIFDENKKHIITNNFTSKSSNSPFIGDEVYGEVKYTICNGEIVYSSEERENAI